MRFLSYILLLFIVSFIFEGCKKDDNPPTIVEEYNPTPYELITPSNFPDMLIPEDNPLTVEGINLGRHLFYEPMLSGDNTQSCGSCHNQAFSFSDNGKRFSTGIDNIEGSRNSMQIVNVGYMNSLFWDGRAATLEEQALEPVVDPIEMHQTWKNATDKLVADAEYPDMFFAAFGTREIDSIFVVKAIAQFERTLISSNSKWDRYLRGEVSLTQSESQGFEIFFTEKGDCFHCHSTILYTDNNFHNNGLNAEFTDQGLAAFTKDPLDIGKFKTPTLRNITLTAPYMHDGRFSSLEEVINFYSEGIKWSPTIDPLMKKVSQGGLLLTPQEKLSLIAFIKTLTDTTFTTNSEFSDPFHNK